MNSKKKTPRKRVPGKQIVKEQVALTRDNLVPLELEINSKAVASKFNVALEALGKFEPKFPSGIILPALTGDPGAEIPGADAEPVYDAKQRATIQGNTIPGFNKDHQHFLFFRIRDVRRAKKFLQWIAPFISSMEEVLSWVRSFRAMRHRLGVNPPMSATWVNIAFAYRAIQVLASEADANAFNEQSFRQGLAARSTYLGDPTDFKNPGHRKNWVVGGPSSEADILVIVAADDPKDLERMVNLIKRNAAPAQLRLLFEQRGDTLPDPLRGHEHFGFKDGVSQPGVRGKVSSAPGDFITPRYIDHTDPRARIYAKPGQLLIWPGQFLLGEPRQDPEHPFAPAPAAVATPPPPAPPNFPAWAALGSYVVCRRLRQNVPAFWKFAVAGSGELGLDPVKFASMLVGRWPSGAPVMRTPASDDATLAGDEWANNHFIFNDPTLPIPLRPIPGYGGDTFPQAMQDMLGAVCPHFAHIRKANPRDISTDLGKPHDSMLRMVLRRGIPFGPPIAGIKNPSTRLLKQERGLMFICYASTIENQFELLTRRWSNSPVQPNFGGHDPIIGQRDERGARARFIDFPTTTGLRRIELRDEWVIPTGGGYFFSPPIEAIAGVLGA
ncbi:MAG TPA: Dyp-type peroxidase [Pyrinomonadaceae bacterium]|nr:Dyp-type peroxidase [Pyrinomonadaceae bacterium]